MKQRFSKANVLLVLETLIRQAELQYSQRGYGFLTPRVTYQEAERKGPDAMRIHAVYNERRAHRIFIEQWAIQSDAFLKPDHVKDD